MQKFDTSCGLTKKQIDAIKYNVRNEISRQLPTLPEPVETKLFLEGRTAWLFSWRLLNKEHAIETEDTISLEVAAKLKREFHHYQESTPCKFSCKIQLGQDIYRPKVSITKIDA